MLLAVPNVLSPAQVAEGRRLLESADWIDGKATAGHQGARVKDNEQLPVEHPIARQVGETILRALSANPLFMSA
ncbi:MAG: PKHD-type hydroxylase, partial [Verrucomicrobiota bacterium]